MAMLLSSVSPIFASNLAITGESRRSTNSPGVAYDYGSHGSIVLSGDDDYCGVDYVSDRGDLSIQNRDQKISAEEQYNRFITTKKFSQYSPYGIMDKRAVWTGNGQTSENGGYMGGSTGGGMNILPRAYGIYSFVTGCGAYASGNYSTAFGAGATAKAGGAQAFGVSALARGKASIAFGIGSEAKGDSSVAFGGLAASIGGESVAFGYRSKAQHDNSVAIGSHSLANTHAGKNGYHPGKGALTEKNNYVWKSTLSAASVGDVDKQKTRQITAVAAGSEDTDAVNVAQLKALREYAKKGWRLSIGSETGATSLEFEKDDVLRFLASSNQNLKITKGSDRTSIIFDLSNNIKVQSVTAGRSSLTNDGLVITSGPSVEFKGINAGGKEIKGVKNGLLSADSMEAVSGQQLYIMGNQFATYLDSSAEYNNGQWVAPRFEVTHEFNADGTAVKTIYNNVASAFKGIDSGISKLSDRIINVEKNISSYGLNWDKTKKAYNAIYDGMASKIVNVADGTIGENSRDAVNGAQLFATNQNVTTVTSDLQKIAENTSKYLGGNADVLNGTAPTYTVDGKTYNDFGSAFTGVNKSLTEVNKSITDVNKSITDVNKSITDVQNQITGNISQNALLWSEDEKAFVARHGAEKANSKIKYLQDGSISNGSTEAITGNQLYSMGNKLAQYLGGNAKYENGEWTAPSFKIKTINADGNEGQEKTYNTVADALANVSSSVTNIHKEIKNEITKVVGDSLVQQNKETQYITIGAEKDGTEISILNKDKKERVLSGIKAGTLSAESTEAVNGAQLFATNQNVTTVTNSVATVTGNLQKIAENTSKYLGGGANVLDGTAPTYTVDGKTYNDFGSAFTGVDKSLTDVNKSIADVQNQITGNISQNALLWSEDKKAFTALHKEGSKESDSKITHLQAGDITKDSTDAINGAQLYSMSNQLAQYLGGNAKYENGEWTAPSFTFKTVNANGNDEEQSYKTIAEAFTGVSDSVKNIHNEINKEIKNEITKVVGDSLVQQDDKTHLITIGGKKGGTNISIANSDGAARTLSGIKAGTLSAESTEAVNGAQLFATNQNVTTVTSDLQKIAENTSKYLGGNADVLNGTAPTYTVDGKTYNDFGSAFTGVNKSLTEVNKSITDVNKSITDVQNQITGNISQNALLWSEDEKAFVARHGAEKANSKIKYLQDGSISNGSTEAITGNQLYSMGNKLAQYLGGNAKYENGEWTAPSFKIKTINADGNEGQEKTYNTVADALANVSSSVTNIHKEIKNEITKVVGDSLVQQNKETQYITIGAEKDGTEISILNKDKKERVLSGIKAGTLSAESTEAVNGAQLFATNQNVTTVTNSVATVTGNLQKIAENTSKYLGGGANVLDGTAPTYTVDGKTYNDFGSAFTGVDKSLTDVNKSIADVQNQITGNISQNALLWSEDKKAFTALHKEGSKESDSKITHLQAGDITKDSTDAINGAQLYSMSNQLAQYLGGNAKYENGEWTAPSFTFKTVNANGNDEEQSYKTIAEAFTGVSDSVKNIHNEINKEIKNEITKVVGDSLVQQDDKTHLITIGGKKGGTNISIANSDGAARTLSGIKAGTLSATSTEAVNGAQLFATNQNVTTVTNSVATVTGNLQKIAENTSKYLGGNADVLNGTAPTYTVDGKTYNDFGSAFTGVNKSLTEVNKSITDVNKSITDVQNQITGNISQNALLWSEDEKAFVARHGAEKANSKIKYLQDGSISNGSTEAITGNQLYSMGNKLAQYLGGNAKYENGEWTAPSFKIKTINADGNEGQEKTYNTVADALANVSSSVTNIHKEIKNEITKVVGDSLVQQNKETQYITIGAEKDGTEISILNKDKKERVLSGIKAGTLSAESTEAVNGAQLFATNQNVTTVTNSVATVTGNLQKIAENTSKYLGGGANVLDGTAPTYTVDGKTYNDFGSAFTGVDKSLTDVNKSIADVQNQITGNISQNALLWSEDKKAFTALHKEGSKESDSKITHLQAGDITKDSTDAINGAQLYSMSNQLAQYLGGNAKYENGEWTAPSFTFKTVNANGNDEEQSYKTIAEAFTGVSDSVKNIHNEINKEIKNEITKVVGDSLVQQDDKTHLITIGGKKGGTNISIANSDGAARTLSGIKAGTLSATSTEAVNGAQLFATNQNVTTVTNSVATVTGNLQKIAENTSKYLGGNADVLNGTAPTYTVDGKTYNDFGSAFTGVNKSLTEVNKSITDVNKSITDVNKSITDVQNQITGNISQNALLWSEDEKAFVARHGAEKANSKIKYLQDGSISNGSTEAITGNQLYSMGNKLAQYLGGNAKYENGEWTAPSFKIKTINADGNEGQEKTYNTVADALANVSSSVTNIHKEIKNEITKVVGDSLVQQNKETQYITIGAEKDGTEISILNKDKKERVLSGIKAGTLSAESTEAVNGAQLFATNQNVTTVTNSVATVTGNLQKIAENTSKYLGGGANVLDGTAPTYTVDGKTYNDFGSAFTGVDKSLTDVNKSIADVQNQITGNISQNALLWSEDKKAFTALHKEGSKESDSKITHLQAGDITKDSTDAINGAQLYSMSNQLAQYLGGNAKYENGEWTAPSFTFKTVNANGNDEEQSYKTIAEAFTGVSDSVKNIHNEINKEIKNEITKVVGDSLVQQDDKTHLITIGGKKGGTNISIANSDGAARTLSGIKAGTLSATSTEAVNGAQLFATNQNVTTVTNSVATVTGNLQKIAENTSKYLGGGANVLDGTAPTYTVDGKTYNDFGSAFTGVDKSLTDVNKSIADVQNQITGNISQNALLWSEDEKAFVARHGAEKANSKIKYLQDGSISNGSTEAITGNQLYSMGNKLAQYLGGNAKYENGEWTAPSFKIKTINADGNEGQEKTYNTVADALANVSSSVTNIHKEIKNEITKVVGDSLVQQDDKTHLITIGGKKGGTNISIANSDGEARTLSGVKAGTLSATSTEVINGAQLYSIGNTLAKYFGGDAKYENGQWIAPGFKIKTVNSDGSVGEEKVYKNVVDAFEGMSNSVKNIHNKMKDEIIKFSDNNLIKQDKNTHFIQIGGEKEGTGISIANNKDMARILSGVHAGAITEKSTEAVNGAQLYSMGNTLAAYLGGGANYTDGQWVAPKFHIIQFKHNGGIGNENYNTVSDAFDGINQNLLIINDRIRHIETNIIPNIFGSDQNGNIQIPDGKIEQDSHEPVTGGQLWATNNKITEVENKVNTIDEKVDTLDKKVQNVENTVMYGAVNYDKGEDGKKTNKITLKGGNESEPVLIDNVADGSIASGSKEAINGGQLYDYTQKQKDLVLKDAKKYTDTQINNVVNEAKSYTDMKFEALSYGIEDTRKEARQAAAVGLAVSNLHYHNVPGSLSISLGSGLWRSQSAFAFGAGYTSENGNVRSNLSVTSTGGYWGVGAGISLRLK
ncbi:YadA-like family protein [Bartonella sp. B35(2025)]